MRPITVCLPDTQLAPSIDGLPGVTIEIWDWESTPPRADVFVPPYMSSPDLLRRLPDEGVLLVQSQSIGFDGVAESLSPGTAFANAVSVHEESTAELAVALALAATCGIGVFVREGSEGLWHHRRRGSLADADALVIGHGGVGRLIVERLRPLCRSVTAAGRTSRREGETDVIDAETMRARLPEFALVIFALPLDASTRRLGDAPFFARLRPGATIVNVSRGDVIDTDALVACLEAGAVSAGLDVTAPEPLPSDHPLWRCENAVITPHVGGHSTAMAPRMGTLLRDQLERLQHGTPLRNLVSLDR